MISDIPVEMITGLIAGGSGAIMRLIAQSQANYAAGMELAIKRTGAEDDSADKAANRSNDSWSRRYIVLVVVFVGFLGLFIASFCDVPVTYLYDSPVKDHLFGLFQTGGEVEAFIGEGFVIPPYVKHSVIAIIFFHFGVGAVKVMRG